MGTETVFIVGAGASHDYGVPIGSGLRKELLRRDLPSTLADVLVPQNDETTALYGDDREVAVSNLIDRVVGFQREFMASEVGTIDTFLAYESARQHLEIARIAMAYVLLHYENVGILTDGVNGVGSVFSNMAQDYINNLAEAPFRIVTFNYERVLQARMARALSVRFAERHPDILLSSLNTLITHVYGSFTTPLVFDGDKGRFMHSDRQYKIKFKEIPPSEYKLTSQSISLIGQQRTAAGETVCASIRQTIDEASHVVFLGFGFDKRNMQLLGFDGNSSNRKEKRFHSTSIKLSGKTKVEASRMVGSEIDFKEVDCKSLLNDLFF